MNPSLLPMPSASPLPAPQKHSRQRVSLSWLILLFALLPLTVQAQEPPRLVVQTGHTGTIRAVCFSPNGRMLASASEDKTVKLWDEATGQEIRTLQHTSEVYSACFSPDGRTLASASDDNMVRLWNVATGQLLKTFKGHTNIASSVCFSPNGKTLASASWDHTIKIWDIATGRLLKTLKGHTEAVNSVSYSPDGRTLASGSGDYVNHGTLKLWDAATGQILKTLRGHKDVVNSVSFSPNGRMLASGSTDNTVKIWDTATGHVIRSLTGITNPVYSVCFSPDSRTLASGEFAGDIIIWDPTTGKQVRVYQQRLNIVYSLCFSPDGKILASASNDKTVKLWKMATGKLLAELAGHSSNIHSVRFSPDGTTIASAGGEIGKPSTIKIWNLATGQQIKALRGHADIIKSVSFSRDGRLLASAGWDKTVKLWDAATGQLLKTFKGHTDTINLVCFSPDSRTLASASADKTIKIWDIESGKQVKTLRHSEDVGSVCFSPDGETIASGTGDGNVQLWNVATGKQIKTLNGDDLAGNSLCFSPDGKILASTDTFFRVTLWEIATGHLLKTLNNTYGNGDSYNSQNSLCFSPDGKTLAGASFDNIVKLWDIATGKTLQTLTGHTNDISSVCFSPDGGTLASASMDGSVRLWNASSGQPMVSLYSIGDTDWVTVTPDGRFDGTPEGLKSLHWVQDNKPIALESFFSQFYTPHLMARVLKGDTLPPPTVNLAQGIKPPPSVQITSPTAGQAIDGDTVQVTVQATDEGGGVQDIRLFQNGTRISDDQKKIVEVPAGDAKTLTRTFSVTLVPGQNILKALAANTDQTDSNPAEITLELKAAPSSADLYILATGIEAYKNPQFALPYCKSDAQAFAEAVALRGKSIFGSVHTTLLTDDQVTKGGLEAAFAQIKAQAKPTDAFVFYYSGHGYELENDAVSPDDFYLVCQDVLRLDGADGIAVKGLSAQRLKELATEVPALKKLLVLDACQSGGAISAFSKGLAEETAIAQLAHSTGTVVLAASLKEQSASVFDALKHSVFTYALLQGLSGDADPPPGDGKVTVKKLDTYLDDALPRLTQKYGGQTQYPESYAAGQDFPLGVH